MAAENGATPSLGGTRGETAQRPAPSLLRGMKLRGAVALTLIDMIGVGPFITLPLMVAAMGGPQAILGWVLGAVFAVCDGCIWAELGASFPGPGGSYRYLSECFGPRGWGRLLSFLYVWQLSFSAPLSIASGCIGFALYAGYLFPGIAHAGTVAIAVSACLLAMLLGYRRISAAARVSQFLCIVVLGTVGWVIFAAATHFNAHQAFDFSSSPARGAGGFVLGLGSAMLIAAYDYWGYYSAGFLGGEIERPERNIPRAILISIGIVAVLYVTMSIGILGVVPWREMTVAGAPAQSYVISVFMQRAYGVWAARMVTGLVMATAFASVFALLLGYARVPYAAALDGNYFRAFARLHPRGQFPTVSLLALGGAAALFCFFSLSAVIAALVVIRITLQFFLQAVGLLVLRRRNPETARPFRMPWYPLPVMVAIVGFIYVLAARSHSWVQLGQAGIILVLGLAIYGARARWHARAYE